MNSDNLLDFEPAITGISELCQKRRKLFERSTILSLEMEIRP